MAKAPQKEKETFSDKFKQLLRLKNAAPQSEQNLRGKPEPYVLTHEFIKDISKESPVNQRIKALKRLIDEMHGKKLEENGVEVIWVKIRDLIQTHQPKHLRQTAYDFINFLVITQYEGLDLMRPILFDAIAHSEAEDLIERIELLKSLTKTGREIELLEEEIGPFLLYTTSSALGSTAAIEFLKILINLIKFQSAYLDKPVIKHIVSITCHYACKTAQNDGVTLCLEALDAIIGFSWLPADSLECLITTLCRTVNIEHFCHASLKLVRNLLGTHLGHSGLHTMCKILEQPANRDDVALLRGAVFFTAMCLWGSQRVSSLKLSHSVVLPYFLKALEGNNLTVAMEVCLSVQRLVRKYGNDLQPGTWDLVLQILDTLNNLTMGRTSGQSLVLASTVHDILTVTEQLYTEKLFNGCEKRLFAFIEKCSPKRPESSVFHLLKFRASSINPLKANWLGALKTLIDTYFKQETRVSIRIKVLEILGDIYNSSRYIYEDDIVERIIIPSLNHIELDQEMEVRKVAIQLLLTTAQECSSKLCLEILEILTRVVLQPFDPSHYPGGKSEAQETVHVITESEIVDVKTTVLGLIKLFEKKLYELPSSVAITIYKVLLKHVLQQYESSSFVLKDAGVLRLSVFECFLKLRADEYHRLGILDTKTGTRFSSYLYCGYSEKFTYGATSPPLTSPTPFSYPSAVPTYTSLDLLFQVVSVCLKQEKEWSVMKCVLLELPKLLQNKTLMLSSPGAIGNLCRGVCALISDRSMKLPETLRNAPVTLSRPEFHLHVYPIQIALVSYNKYLESNIQYLLVSCLKHGVTSKCAPTCVSAFTICVLEMTKIMNRVLPAILLTLSKISATVNIAVSILEFLSTLIRIPDLYASFVQEQFMSIFAIAVPYTNPSKFNHYVVSLAHHVIAMWLIKCRVSYRKYFVRFIRKALTNNIILPLSERAAQGEQAQGQEQGTNHQKKPGTSTFHHELTETCFDLLTRYTFAQCYTLPKRSPIAEFLLESGQSGSWIIGNSIVTITTSGCNVRASRHGLCEKCATVCKKDSGEQSSSVEPPPEASAALAPAPTPVTLRPTDNTRDALLDLVEPSESTDNTRKRHRSAAVRRSLSIDSQEKIPRAKDDLQILKMRGKTITALTEGEKVVGEEKFPTNVEPEPRICSCWCQEWAEILIRRPTGNTSWMMRIQNQLRPDESNMDFPLADLSNMIYSYHQQRIVNEELTKFGHEDIDNEEKDEQLFESQIQELMPDNDAVKGDGLLVAKAVEVAQETTESFGEDPTLLTQASDFVPIHTQKTEGIGVEEIQALDPAHEVTAELLEHSTLRKRATSLDSKRDLREKVLYNEARLSADNRDLKLITESTTSAEVKQAKDQKLGVRFEDTDVVDARLALEENARRRRESGGKLKPLRLPDIRERQIHSPVYNTASAPLSPLPLQQNSMLFGEDMQPISRDRCNTIAVMSPVRPKWFPGTTPAAGAQSRIEEGQYQGINPMFIFLQLYHSFRFGLVTETPIFLPKSELIDRALKVLDHIPPYDTHKIGVLYVGPNQADNESEILANVFGSARYANFLQGLGNLVRLKDVNPQEIYVGGMDLTGPDGMFAYVWKDDVMQVIYHVATLMPTKKTDPCCNQKKLHIGNDFVSIVYNDSGKDYNMHTIKGQFIYACVIIQPLDCDSNLVSLKIKPELSALLGVSDPRIVSESNLALLVRQWALHANLASMILQSQQRSLVDPYASNWLERHRQIRRIREKAPPPPREDDSPSHPESYGASAPVSDDFTRFV